MLPNTSKVYVKVNHRAAKTNAEIKGPRSPSIKFTYRNGILCVIILLLMFGFKMRNEPIRKAKE